MVKSELPEVLRILSQSRLELIESAGHSAQVLGFPKSIGEIYGLLYLAPQPLSSPQICEVLSPVKEGLVRVFVNWQLWDLSLIHI